MIMLDHMRSVLIKQCQLVPDQKVVVGVSGGPDSLCLLTTLWKLNYPLVIGHLDHGLRPESRTESEQVARLAEQLHLICHIEKEDVHTIAEEHHLSLEEAGRIVRYRFLFRLAKRNDAQAVAVGHTADDQVETILMHLIRGSGLSGLRGMPYRALPNTWSQTIPLVRPLLGIWRWEIMAYINELGLQPAIDTSNQDVRFFRNSLRLELIPFLERYNPQFRQLLSRTADVLREDEAIISTVVKTAWQDCVDEIGNEYILFDMQELIAQPIGVKRRLLRKATYLLRPELRDVDFETTERAIHFLDSPPQTGQLNLVAGLRLVMEGKNLWLTSWEADLPNQNWPQVDPESLLHLTIPGEVLLHNGWKFIAQVEEDSASSREQALQNTDLYQTWVDSDRIQNPLVIRSRRFGDRFKPLGLEGHSVKLAEFFVNLKLPRRARDCWPLVLSGEEIVWLPGFRLAHPFRIQTDTKRVVKLSLLKN